MYGLDASPGTTQMEGRTRLDLGFFKARLSQEKTIEFEADLTLDQEGDVVGPDSLEQLCLRSKRTAGSSSVSLFRYRRTISVDVTPQSVQPTSAEDDSRFSPINPPLSCR